MHQLVADYKIYLIDEVHMLSQHSFNALLKTLEEPPAHVKFILATTDPQKLPVTVLSRCLQFNLRHLPTELISQHLQMVLSDEQLDFEKQALDLLAQAARGSMRDALSLLDQAITSCDTTLMARDVKIILGYTQQDYTGLLLQALLDQNASKLITLSQQITTEGGHFHYVLDELLNYLHQMTVYQCLGDNNPLISPSAEIKSLAKQFSGEDIQLFYQIALKGREEIHLAPTLDIGFNMTMLRMLTFRPAPKVAKPDLPTLENKTVHQQPAIESHPVIDLPIYETAPPPLDHNQAQNWTEIIAELKLTGLALNAIENAELVSKEGREVSLRVAKGHQSLFTPTVITRIETALTNYYQSPISIVLNARKRYYASPAQQKERCNTAKTAKCGNCTAQ